MNGIPEDKYSTCEETGLRVCEIFDTLLVREDGMCKRTSSENGLHKQGWYRGCVYGELKRTYKRLHIQYKGKNYVMSRLIAKAFVDGYDDFLVADHINGDTFNNSAANLRWVTIRDNGANTHKHRSGKLVGTSFHKTTGKYSAQCKIKGKKIHLGLFDTEEKAHEAYLKYKKENSLC